MVKFPIYMDCHATTPVDPRVLESMLPYFTEEYGNASSIDHIYGSKAADVVEKARKQVAELINASPTETIFTSGATESDNIAIQGIAKAYEKKGRHIVTCTTEHKAVLDTCTHLESLGWSVTRVPVDHVGTIDLQKLEECITNQTVLISVAFANNEIGTIAPIEEIGKIARDHGVLFHTDAAQAVGHIPVDVQKMNIDMMSISAHKVYGPKGIGVLYIRHEAGRTMPTPITHGGGQERALRPGTLNVPAIVGAGKALSLARREMHAEGERLASWANRMKVEFLNRIESAEQNGHPVMKLPHNLNMYFRGTESKAIIQAVSSEIAISAGSACTTKSVEPSHVILALGYDEQRAHSSVRFGLSRFNTEEEVGFVIDRIVDTVNRLRRIGGRGRAVQMS